MRQTIMNDENRSSNLRVPPIGRVTRARAKTFGSSVGGLPPLHPSTKQNDKPVSRANLKRAVSDDNTSSTQSSSGPQHKKRAALKDVTNVTCGKLYSNIINATKDQARKHDRRGSIWKNGKVAPASYVQQPQLQGNNRGNVMEEMNKVKVEESNEKETALTETLANVHTEIICAKISVEAEGNKLCKEDYLEESGIVDIDAKHQDPKMCSMYAADIYSSLHAVQLDRRPMADYMEKLQQDITHGMRGILIDWLVEVSEEYRLVPDTLYLTVNLIDRFLSKNFIEKQKLQLLGVTCMLIASKYEEICAPRVEEFCFITDNTYSKEEVVKMESCVLNILGFQLSVPTTKKFLRRFIQAAQASYEVPSVELEYLANYLAELTLIEYSFLKFLPSMIAASVVFLARWTLDQSDHPWNPTLEYYTRYTALELKCTVLELQDLQLKSSKSMLKAIREKYAQAKLKSVSTMCPTKPVQSLF